ncbi:hypothetical protein EV198_3112 [Roseivirga ehrenbergii]|nr:hypothetical protein EV198_3112 [Roseivirga ehrenbergii]
MKQKRLVISTLLLFLIVNTISLWDGKLGFLAFPLFLLLVVVYLILAVLVFRQLFFAIREKFKDKQRLGVIGALTIVLTLILLKPNGLIDFDKLQGEDLLVAEREGAANCMTTLKLKENNTFTERSVCFGVTEIKGNYELKGDTVFFRNVGVSRNKKSYYKFAVIYKSKTNKIKYLGDIVLYDNAKHKTGNELWITKNELTK